MNTTLLRALRRVGSTLWLVIAAASAQAQVVCAPTATPSPAIVNQSITLRGNCSVNGVLATAGSEVWTVGANTLTRPLAAPPLVVSFAAAGSQALSVQLDTGVLSAPFPLTLVVQAQAGAVGGRVTQLAAPLQQTAQTSVRTQLSNITNRLRYLRTQSGTPLVAGSVSTSSGTASTSSGEGSSASGESSGRGPGDGAPSADATRTGRLGVYIAGGYEVGTQSAVGDVPGFRARTTGATAGVDYRLSKAWVIGGGLGMLDTNTRFSVGTGEQFAKGRSGTVYGSWSPTPSLYVDAALALDRSRYELKRDDLIGDAAFARTRGKGRGLTISAGYDKRFGAWSLSPYGRAEQVDVRIQSFDEFGSVNALALGEQRLKVGSFTLGGQAQYSLGTSYGIVTPHARIELSRLVADQQDPVRARLLNSSTVLFIDSPAGRIDRSYGTYGFGVSAQMRRGVSMFLDAEGGFGQANYRLWRVNSGVKLEL